jgi:hypothetical protein
MDRVAFVRDVRRQNAGSIRQQSLLSHTRGVLDDLVCTQVIGARLVRAISVVKDHDVKMHLAAVKGRPRLFEQRRRIRSVKDASPLSLNRIEEWADLRVVVCGKGRDAIGAGLKLLIWLNRTKLEV